VRFRLASLIAMLPLAAPPFITAQSNNLIFPRSVAAGSAFSVKSSEASKGTLYIVGLGQVIKRDLEPGQSANIEAGALHSAGHYLVFLVNEGPTETGSLEVTPAKEVADLSFLARPSRLPVSLRGGITGAVYIFDPYNNLVTAPTSVTFELSSPNSTPQKRSVMTRNGSAWTQFDSTAHQGNGKFVANVGAVSSERVIGQVPGDPCGLRMIAVPAGGLIKLQTDPIRDCSGNAVPDGTVVTFTASYNGDQSTVDVPIKRGIAEAQIPTHPGAVLTVASGVVMGNQIRWGNK